MDEHVETFVDGIVLNRDAANADIDAIKQNVQIAKTVQVKTDNISHETNLLSGLAKRLEERDARSKWEWATIGAAMLISAGLA